MDMIKILSVKCWEWRLEMYMHFICTINIDELKITSQLVIGGCRHNYITLCLIVLVGLLSLVTTDILTLTSQHGTLYQLDGGLTMRVLAVAGLDVLHMSAANCTDTVRLSCDTRWQPASAERDPRLVLWRGSGGTQV